MSNYNAVAARNTELAPKNIGPYSQSVAFSHYNNLSAQLPIDPESNELVEGGVVEQAAQCLENIESVLVTMNKEMSDVVRLSVFLTNIKDMDKVDEVVKYFYPTYVPTRTTVAVNELPMGASVQIEALVSHGEGSIPNAPQSGDLIKLVNNTSNAPMSALSSQTVAFSHYNNISAQLPINPVTNQIVPGGVKEQAIQCLKNIKAITNSIDVPMDDIVKMNVYVTDLKDIEAVKEVYTTFFPDSSIARSVQYFPALSFIEAKTLPMYALVQMEAVVSHGDGTPPQLVEDRHGIVIYARNTDKAPKCDISTQTVAFSHYNHISAILPVCAKTGELEKGGVAAETTKVLTHLKSIVESIDHKLEDTVKVNVFLKNISDLSAVDEAYQAFFPEGTPARRVVGVKNLPKGASIMIDAVVSNAEGTPPLK